MNAGNGEWAYEISRELSVDPERVFGALTDATVLNRIWGVQHITVDARVGGHAVATYITEEVDWSFTNTFTEVVPNESLAWTTHFANFPTKETRVRALMHRVANGTRLTIRMENFESEAERDANKEAWQHALETLSTILA